MIFPSDTREKICDRLNCPNRNTYRTHGICVKHQNNKYIKINSVTPSVAIIFRDPTIENTRNVPYVLDINSDIDGKITSRLFNTYNKYLLQYFPENEVIFLDNFIRCSLPISREELSANYLNLIKPYASNCFEILHSYLEKIPDLKCLIFTNAETLFWIEKRGNLQYQNPQIRKYFEGFIDKEIKRENIRNHINSTTLLDECFKVDDWGFPIFFFPHPVTLQRQYMKYYEVGKPYHEKFENGRKKIIKNLR